MPILSQIFIYPIKSLAGIQLPAWEVDNNGLRYDRKWMLVDGQGQFLSQRRLPKMALIKPRMERDSLILSAPGQRDFEISLHPSGGGELAVEIWRDRCLARTVSSAADDWFGTALQTDCSLVYLPDDQIRQVDQRYALAEDQTAFSDGFPFLLVSENSLNALNRLLQTPVSILRFRPNLVLADCESFAEDAWRRIKINDIEFRLPKPCSRCSVPGIDPETALSAKEPLATLNRMRRWDNHIYFGQNALHDRPGQLAVGDRVDILAYGEKQPPLS
ncbi:MOSC domain-containing protein [Methylomonas sp. SURF-2]|uniref:MOSC domain-containing protein n=1 Tax=Methylomonas subterranea TaxID=2952225 RepID=A0ABT1TE57_9GAMM|nr:MOSC N-terminal beta barrel domain-containing protein [Methylomonas sp. SURF-2]MCQ8103746.1 MOSC domain-containing protein [Methylomonas sp. SURF-2]